MEDCLLQEKKKWRRHTSIVDKKSKSEVIVLSIFFVIFLAYAISLVVPFAWIAVNSLKTNNDFFADRVTLKGATHFFNYITAFTELSIDGVNLIGMFFNSIVFTLISTVPTIACSAMSAYVMSKYKFKLRNFLYGLIIGIQVIPIVGTTASFYKLMLDLHFMDNPALLWLIFTNGFNFAFILMFGYFNSISWEYAESAQMDGAGNLTVFLRIMLPQAKPIIVALFITTAIGSWNDYMTPYMYLPSYPNVALGIYRFELIQQFRSNIPILFAAVMMSAFPVFIMYALFHKIILENTVAGGLKG